MFESRLEGSDGENQVDTWGDGFLAEGTASTKVLKQVHTWCVKYTAGSRVSGVE